MPTSCQYFWSHVFDCATKSVTKCLNLCKHQDLIIPFKIYTSSLENEWRIFILSYVWVTEVSSIDSLHSPKSVSLTCPFASNKMFSGFKSRYIIPYKVQQIIWLKHTVRRSAYTNCLVFFSLIIESNKVYKIPVDEDVPMQGWFHWRRNMLYPLKIFLLVLSAWTAHLHWGILRWGIISPLSRI